jgi:hypothetical protein
LRKPRNPIKTRSASSAKANVMSGIATEALQATAISQSPSPLNLLAVSRIRCRSSPVSGKALLGLNSSNFSNDNEDNGVEEA